MTVGEYIVREHERVILSAIERIIDDVLACCANKITPEQYANIGFYCGKAYYASRTEFDKLIEEMDREDLLDPILEEK